MPYSQEEGRAFVWAGFIPPEGPTIPLRSASLGHEFGPNEARDEACEPAAFF